jgi:hypothetical protein
MGGSIYTSSYSGVGAMLRSAFLEADMRSRASRVADIGRATAPVYHGAGEDPHRGRYKDSFEVTSTRAWHTHRCAGIVTNTAPEAAEVEWGVKHVDARGNITVQPGHHTLLRALMAGAG